jgi:protein-L-isoaspartate(D-aspartate) O-methyltransferase
MVRQMHPAAGRVLDPDRYAEKRHHMVRRHISARGVRHPAVLRAMQTVRRETFLPPEQQEFAYDDTALPIAAGQTISQPYIVALMIAALQPHPEDRVLEIGTGSGYAAAILSRVVQEVYTVERHAELAELARRRLHDLGYANVRILHGDGTLGWPEQAPFDGIVVTAGGPKVPAALREQLAVAGRLVMPVGTERSLQHLIRVWRKSHLSYQEDKLGKVRFVPLVGAQGWQHDSTPATAYQARRRVG